MIHNLMMGKISGFIKSYRGPIVAGLMYGTSYIPFPPWAILFCLAPLFLFLLETTSRKRVFLGAWLTQFILTLIGFHWIAFTAHEFGQFPWPVSVVVLVLFAGLIHLHVPIAALIAHELRARLHLKPVAALFVFAIVFALVERAWPMIFPFHLGYTLLWAKLPIAQWADVIGFAGLSTLIWLANAWIAALWRRHREGGAIFNQGLALIGLVLALTVGALPKKQAWKDTDDRIDVLTVQADIGNFDKVYAEQGKGFQATITYKYMNLTQQGLLANPGAQLIMWPETAFPDTPDRPERSRKHLDILKAGLGGFGVPLLTGGYARDAQSTVPGQPPATYNALFLLGPTAEILSGPYRKTTLLAFGEYLPFSEEFPILLKWLPFISNFGRGHGPDPLTWRRPDGSTVKIGGQICYEGLFPDFTRGLAEQGAQVLANVTNDSWFGTLFAPRQHMIMTLARAIEVRRPLIRSTNTGITTAILASGDMLERSPQNEEWSGLFPVAFKKDPGQTIYVRFGHFDWVLLLIALAALLAGGRSHARASSPGLDRGS